MPDARQPAPVHKRRAGWFQYVVPLAAIAALYILATPPPVLAQARQKVNSRDGLTYIWIEPGSFQMGCSAADSECQENERPAHRVMLTKGFWIGQTEVTQGAYKKVTGESPSRFQSGDQGPVDSLWWDNAQAYCQAVGMRLPTEAEWEYAARGGEPVPRYGPLPEVAWFAENSGGFSHPVAQKKPNAFGLYDMLGNVWEWVADYYGPYSAEAVSDPKGPQAAHQHVLRGGSCFHDATLGRASTRGEGSSRKPGLGRGANDYGFRCAGD
jgi:formylglycine-generating enzyme required for sulfatase activity